MTLFTGQTENAGHFLQPTTIAIGHKVISFLPYWLCALWADKGSESNLTYGNRLIPLILALTTKLSRVWTILWRL